MTSRSLHVAVALSPGEPAGTVTTAERAGFTFATFDDPPLGDPRPDTEPNHVAAQPAGLDHAAWVVVAGGSAGELAAEVAEAVRRLWDSRGTGRPVVLASDTLAEAVRPDIVLVGGAGLDDVRTRARRARDTGAPLVFAEVEVSFDARLAPAGRKPHRDRLRYTGSVVGLTQLLGWLATSVDGVRLHAGTPAALPTLAAEVLPALRAEGLLTSPEPGATLRESLGLAHPVPRSGDAT